MVLSLISEKSSAFFQKLKEVLRDWAEMRTFSKTLSRGKIWVI
jgi:hypothetical protein